MPASSQSHDLQGLSCGSGLTARCRSAALLLRAAGAGGPKGLEAAHPSSTALSTSRSAGSVAVLVLADMQRGSVLWGWSRLALQRWPLRHVPGLGLAKVLGSGHEGGFGLRPSRSRQGLFLIFVDESHARAFVDHSSVLAAYRARSSELLVALLRASSSKGSWSGVHMDVTAPPPWAGPVASLTRASIRPSQVRRFWRMQPAAEAALANAPGCLLAAGVGEAPLLRQATFTVWRDVDAMDAYARSGAHAEAIRAAYGGGFFSESMFVRFAPVEIRGTWLGVQHG